MSKVYARSASDNTDDWPFWMVWNGHLNVTALVGFALSHGRAFNSGAVFTSRQNAERMSEAFNAWSAM
jgi:hypothetical protein